MEILLGIAAIAAVMWFFRMSRQDDELRQRKNQRIRELEEEVAALRLEQENQKFIREYGIKRLPNGRFQVASPEEQAAAGRKK